jgi:hypothetical protein
MIVESDGDTYMYITKNGMRSSALFRATPEYVNKKSFWDLSVHFGLPSNDLKRIFAEIVMLFEQYYIR